jgi:hypothetical protein
MTDDARHEIEGPNPLGVGEIVSQYSRESLTPRLITNIATLMGTYRSHHPGDTGQMLRALGELGFHSDYYGLDASERRTIVGALLVGYVATDPARSTVVSKELDADTPEARNRVCQSLPFRLSADERWSYMEVHAEPEYVYGGQKWQHIVRDLYTVSQETDMTSFWNRVCSRTHDVVDMIEERTVSGQRREHDLTERAEAHEAVVRGLRAMPPPAPSLARRVLDKIASGFGKK